MKNILLPSLLFISLKIYCQFGSIVVVVDSDKDKHFSHIELYSNDSNKVVRKVRHKALNKRSETKIDSLKPGIYVVELYWAQNNLQTYKNVKVGENSTTRLYFRDVAWNGDRYLLDYERRIALDDTIKNKPNLKDKGCYSNYIVDFPLNGFDIYIDGFPKTGSNALYGKLGLGLAWFDRYEFNSLLGSGTRFKASYAREFIKPLDYLNSSYSYMNNLSLSTELFFTIGDHSRFINRYLFFDVGIGYNFPLYFSYTERNQAIKKVYRRAHNFKDVRLFSRFSSGFVFFEMGYSMFDYTVNGIPNPVRWTGSIGFTIPED